MKRLLILSALVMAVMTGCGGSTPEEKTLLDADIAYEILDLDEEKAYLKDYVLMRYAQQGDYDKDYDFYSRNNLESLLQGSDTLGEYFSSVDELEKAFRDFDMDKKIAEMDDITDKTLVNDGMETKVKVYQDKKYNYLYFARATEKDYASRDMVQNYFINDIYKKTALYNDMVNEVCNKTGLVYNGTVLGKTDVDSDVYNGKNIVSFVNDEMKIIKQIDDNWVYRDMPLQVDFYMVMGELDHMQIHFLTDKESLCPDKLTEDNLSQLSFDEKYGGESIKEILNQCVGSGVDKEGSINGINWEYKSRVYSSGFTDVDYNVVNCYFKK